MNSLKNMKMSLRKLINNRRERYEKKGNYYTKYRKVT